MGLNVNAIDKASGKSEKIRIERNGQLNQADIDRMVAEAEKFKVDDDAQRERVAAKNALEAYAYSSKQALEADSVKTKLDDTTEIAPALQKISEAITWLDANQLATKEEFEHYKKELEATISPLMAKLHATADARGAGSKAPHAPNPHSPR